MPNHARDTQIDQASFSGMPPERAVKLSQCIMDRMRGPCLGAAARADLKRCCSDLGSAGDLARPSDGKDSPVVRASNERSDLTTRRKETCQGMFNVQTTARR